MEFEWNKVATTLGILGGLFALVRGGYDFWNEVHKSPGTELNTAGSPLDLSYDPVSQTLEFTFNMAVDNTGTEADVIRGGSATFERLGGSRTLLMSSSAVKLYDNQVKLPIPWVVPTSYQRTVRCVVSSEPGMIRRNGIEPSRELSRLSVSLEGKAASKPSAELCFYGLTEEVISRLFTRRRISFLSSQECGAD